MDRTSRLLAAVARHRGRVIPGGDLLRTAAVAAILRSTTAGPEVLLIRRPERPGDRWSGNYAFPGGLSRPGDGDSAATAARETREEVGLDLGPARGQLSQLLTAEPGRRRPMRVVPVVFSAPTEAKLDLDPREAADAFWVSLSLLRTLPRRRHWRKIGPVGVPFPGVAIRGRLLWGLTFMMIEEISRLDEVLVPAP